MVCGHRFMYIYSVPDVVYDKICAVPKSGHQCVEMEGIVIAAVGHSVGGKSQMFTNRTG